MSGAAELLAIAHARGIQTTADGSRLRVRGPRRALTAKMKRLLVQYKPEILAMLVTCAVKRSGYETSRNIGK